MVFQIRTYSVLMVSSSEKFNQSLFNLLPVTDFWPINVVSNTQEARRALLENTFDLVIINTPLPDEFGSRFSIDVCTEYNCGVLLLVKNDVYESVNDKVMEYGVAVVSKPAPVQVISQSIKMLCTMRERIRRMEEKQASVEEKIAEIRLINHAKWVLIEKKGITEDEAQKYIEKTSMDKRISKKKVADDIIKELENE